jgi:hypothetical protein
MPSNAKPQHSFSHFLPKSSQVPLCGAAFNSFQRLLSFGSQLMAEVGSSKRRLLVVPGPSYGTLSSWCSRNPASNSIKKPSVLQVGLGHEDIFI